MPRRRARCAPRRYGGSRSGSEQNGFGPSSRLESAHCTRWNCGGRRSPGPEKICYTSQPRAVSSAVEHSPHTGGATGSIPVPPTTSAPVLQKVVLPLQRPQEVEDVLLA